MLLKRKGTWFCRDCNASDTKRDVVRRHIIIDHLKDIPKVCEVCGESFYKGGLAQHRDQVHFNTKRTKRISNLKSMDLSEALRLFKDDLKCKKCGKIFKSDVKIRAHIKNVHLKQLEVSCDLCDNLFVSEDSKLLHMFKVHNVKADAISLSPADEKLKQIAFIKSNIELAHTFERDGILHYECPVCKKEVMRAAGLRIHLRMVHLGIKSQGCDLCDRTYGSATSLSYHKKSAHNINSTSPAVKLKQLDKIREMTAKTKSYVKQGKTYYQCGSCQKFLCGKQTLRLHYMSLHFQSE